MTVSSRQRKSGIVGRPLRLPGTAPRLATGAVALQPEAEFTFKFEFRLKRLPGIIALLLLGAGNAALAGTPEPAISVPGMKQYTDVSFGFSFWYPATWTVTEDGYDKDRHPYSGGTVIKSLVVTPPAATYFDPIHLREFVSSDKEVIDSSNAGPIDDPPLYSAKYYFDDKRHLWMTESKGTRTSNWSPPEPADMSENSMGGLHLFSGTARFDADTIIPLSAKKFVIADNDNAGASQKYLAATIVALNPAVAAPVNGEEQIKAIRTEGVLYGAVGKRLGDFYVDDQYVYDSQAKIIPGVNSKDFKLISKFSDGASGVSEYGTDGMRVYFAAPEVLYGDGATANEILEGADPGTFTCLRQVFNNGGGETGFTKDKSHVWYLGRLIAGADPNAFVITGPFAQNPDGTLTIAHDDKHTFGVDGKDHIVVEK